MWFHGPTGRYTTLVFSVLQQTCLTLPPHHYQASDSPVNNRGLSHIDSSALQSRVDPITTVRVVKQLRETINIATPDELPVANLLWRIYLDHVSHVLSINAGLQIDVISNVASKLVRLYDLALATIYEIIETHGYPNDPTDDTLSLSLGQVAIEWSCRAGPLCWRLLHEFCLIMKEKARQGWTGIYSGELVNVGTGVVTWVKLSIRRDRGG